MKGDVRMAEKSPERREKREKLRKAIGSGKKRISISKKKLSCWERAGLRP